MAEQRKVTVQVGVEAGDTAGKFAPLDKSAKAAQASADALGKKLQAVNRLEVNPFRSLTPEAKAAQDAVGRFSDGLAKIGRETQAVGQLTKQLQQCGLSAEGAARQAGQFVKTFGSGVKLATGDVQRLATAMKSADPTVMARHASVFDRMGGAVQRMNNGLQLTAQLGRGLAFLGGGPMEQMLRTVATFQGIADTAGALTQIGSAVGGFLARPTAQAAGGRVAQIGGSVMGHAVAGATGAAAIHAAPSAASAVSGSTTSTLGATLAAPLVKIAAILGGFVSAFDTIRQVGRGMTGGGWNFRDGLGGAVVDAVVPESWFDSVARWTDSGVQRSNQTAQRMAARQRDNVGMRARREQLFTESLAARGPMQQFQRGAVDSYFALNNAALANYVYVRNTSAERRRDARTTELEYRRQRGERDDATGVERWVASAATRERFQALTSVTPGASPESLSRQDAAVRNRQRAERMLREQQRLVQGLDARVVVGSNGLPHPNTPTFAARQEAMQRLLQLQQQLVAATNQEAQASHEVRESTIQRMTAHERLLGVELQSARTRADSYRDETRAGARSLAQASGADQNRLLRISAMLANPETAGNLRRSDVTFAQGYGLMTPQLNQLLDRRADESPVIAEILRNSGRTMEQANRDNEVNRVQQMQVTLQQRIEVEMSQSADALLRGVTERLTPIVTALVEDAGRAINLNVAQQAFEALVRTIAQQQAAGAPSATGGTP